MKITDVKTLITFAGWRNFIFVKVITDEGVVGVGEASLEWNELAVAGAIRHLSTLVIGRDPSQIEDLWRVMFRDPYWRGGPVITTALSGIEQALWDISGKKLGVPVYQLLGGKCRERLRAYANAWYKGAATPKDFAERAAKTVEKGYTALKWDPFGAADLIMSHQERKRAIEIVRAVRASVGDEIDLLIEEGTALHPVEIKSGETVTGDMFAALNWWTRLAGDAAREGTLVHGGSETYRRSGIAVRPWFAV